MTIHLRILDNYDTHVFDEHTFVNDFIQKCILTDFDSCQTYKYV